MIPTAAEFYTDFVIKNKSDGKTLDLMIEFAKLHVEAFREECLINLKLGEIKDDVTINLVEKRILNAYYPLNNIK